MKTTTMRLTSAITQDDIAAEQSISNLSSGRHAHTPAISNGNGVPPVDDAEDIFTHAPVSLWVEDFSEVKRRFDQLKRNGVEDLQKHFKKHPEEVLSLARMVTINRVNNETLRLYEAAGHAEFREGLSLIFSKDSYEVFREELIAFWKGRTSFISEAVNLTLTGTRKNILLHAHIPPGFEHTWARIYIVINDITAIRDSMRNLATSEQKYRSVFDTVQTAIVLADAPSGMVIEANKSAKRLFSVSNGEMVGLHLADLVTGEEQDKVRALLGHQADPPVLHVRHKSNGAIPVLAATNTIEIGDASVIVVSFTPTNEAAPTRSANRKTTASHAGLGKKITQREREILRLICSGKTSRLIASQLCISEKTVETHRARIMQKLDTHCVVDLVKIAMANGLAHLQ